MHIFSSIANSKMQSKCIFDTSSSCIKVAHKGTLNQHKNYHKDMEMKLNCRLKCHIHKQASRSLMASVVIFVITKVLNHQKIVIII